jgi:ornithine cyclodeaminase/alanine dehydrogenase-like protein (mu-crystallin family)
MAAPPPFRYLAGRDVLAAMPSLDEQLELAAATMTALATPEASELPPKIGVHPRPSGSFAHAMPAHLRGADAADDLVGMKWVAGYPGNALVGLPAIHAVVILNEPSTGLPVALLDGGPITAARTAAVSGVALRRFGASAAKGRGGPRVAIIGAGVQGHSHVPVVGHVLPGSRLVLHDRHAERSRTLARVAEATPGIAGVAVAEDLEQATREADVVITAASFTSPDRRQALADEWLAPDALVVAVDYATLVTARTASTATLFLVDERGQFLANRDAGQFDGYAEPTATLGEALLAGTLRPSAGRVVVTHLGVGLADLVFGAAIMRRAAEMGLGMELPR